LLSEEEADRRSFLPALVDLGFESPRDVHLVQELVRSMDETWLVSQLPRIVEYLIAKEEPTSEDERKRVADFLALLDPRLAAAFRDWSPPRQPPGASPEVSAVLKLALESLRDQPTGFAQHAIDAALGWSALFIPTSRSGEGDPVVTNSETGRMTVVAFTHERQLAAWGAHQDLVWRSDPAMRTVWRALRVDFDGILLDPDQQNAGVLLPRAGLRAVARDRPQEEIEAGDNFALRIAVEAMRTRPGDLAREAMREALVNGGLLVPVANQAGDGTGESHDFRSAPEQPASERALHVFSDRQALKEGPGWVGDTAAIMRSSSACRAAQRQGYTALVFNAGPSEGLRVPVEQLDSPDV
ncbi:MAG: SseB family protein, partial [Candidatus Dormibacteraeota bacterium]|nr:SseB family protein [Candidatus Dormibacteraeota bacterium]